MARRAAGKRQEKSPAGPVGPETWFYHAFDYSATGMAVVGLDGRYLKVNSTLCSMLGYTQQEMLQRSFQEVTHADDLSDDMELLKKTLAGELDSCRREKRYLHKLGKVVWGLISFSLVRDEEGQPLCFLVQVQDITERRLAEERWKSSHEQLRRLSCHLQTVREEERLQIAREIHDELGQALTAIKLDVAWLEECLLPRQKELKNQAAAIARMVDQSLESLRRILTSLRPALLDDLGLNAAIEWQAKEFEERARIGCHLRLTSRGLNLSRRQSIALFRIFQEALTNVARHAQAGNVWITLSHRPRCLILSVADDGKGINLEETHDGLGIVGMRERAGLLGGDIQIRPRSQGGTEVVVKMPLKPPTPRS